MSYFSSYGRIHGNKADVSCVTISRDDAAVLARHGFREGAPIGVEGFVGEESELLVSAKHPSDHLRSYDPAAGKLIFGVNLRAVRLRSDAGERPLTRGDDVYVSNLHLVERGGRLLLVSTARTVLRPSRKRNAAARRAATLAGELPAARGSNVAAASDTAADSPSRGTVQPGLIVRLDEQLALRLTPEVAARLGVAEGSRVDIEVTDEGRLIVTKSNRRFTLDELLAGMTPDREHRLEDDGPHDEGIP